MQVLHAVAAALAAAGPRLRSLAAADASLTDMHAETHPSQPNYLALFSGDTQGVVDDGCTRMFDVPSLAGELVATGFSFTGYAEDLPSAGFTGRQAGDYVRKHTPWTDFRGVQAGASRPLSAMPTDLAMMPMVSLLISGLCHDLHDCAISEGDCWLAHSVDRHAHWSRTHKSLLIATFDESESDDDRENHITTVAVGEHVTPGPIAERTDHYRLLRTLEDLYDLRPLDTTRFAVEHEVLRDELGLLRRSADRIAEGAASDVLPALRHVDSVLRDRILPHEQAEEGELYPALAGPLGGSDTRRVHQ